MSENPGISIEFLCTTGWMAILLQTLAGEASGAPSMTTEWLQHASALEREPSSVLHVELRATPSASFDAS